MGGGASPVLMLVLLMLVTMTISATADNAATTVIMAPTGPAERLGVSPVHSWW